jgi:hypothetical protein
MPEPLEAQYDTILEVEIWHENAYLTLTESNIQGTVDASSWFNCFK